MESSQTPGLDPGSCGWPDVGGTLLDDTAFPLWNYMRLGCQDGANTLVLEPCTSHWSLSESIVSGKNKICFMRLLFQMYTYIIFIDSV